MQQAPVQYAPQQGAYGPPTVAYTSVAAPQQISPGQQTMYQQQPHENDNNNLQAIEKSMHDMQQRGMTNDPRYGQLANLAHKIRSNMPLVSVQSGNSSAMDPSNKEASLSADQLRQLRAQVRVYKMLARNAPVPKWLLTAAENTEEPKDPGTLLPPPYSHPGQPGDVDVPYNLLHVFSLHQQRANRVTPIPKPVGIDPVQILKEREYRIQNRIGQRIRELEAIPVTIDPAVRIKVEIELRSLRLVHLQRQVRQEVIGAMRRDTTLETALNPKAYRRTKKQSLREARVTEKLEKQQKLQQENKRRERHQEFLRAVLQHAKEFKDYHRNNRAQMARMRKAVVTFHSNTEREKKREDERKQKERMQKLMQEDEEGYRKLLDQQKDKRLVHLLAQTDEYVKSLTGLVRAHQNESKNRKKMDRREMKEKKRLEREERRKQQMPVEGEDSFLGGELHVRIRDISTGKILHRDETPSSSEIEAFLKDNPGYELCSRDLHGGDGAEVSSDDSDDESTDEDVQVKKIQINDVDLSTLDEADRNRAIILKAQADADEDERQGEDYYATAHRLAEKVTAQPNLMVNGQLKSYQLRGLEWMVSLYNNNLNGILADEMGLGKTIQTIALVCYLIENKKLPGPFLIIVPLSTVSNWDQEFSKWAPRVIKVIYKGNPNLRRAAAAMIRGGKFNVLLTTYEYIIKDKALLSKVHWKYMIIDEGHRMKNHHCKLTQIINTYYTSAHRVLLTGTPLQNKLPELWALLNFLLPSIFKSCANFENWFNAPFSGIGEKVDLNPEETMLIIRRLHKVLRPFLLRRLKKEVESELPDKTEYVLKCGMSALQSVLYKHMHARGVLLEGQKPAEGQSDAKKIQYRSLMNTVMHLRKLCNHPFLFDTIEDDMIRHLKPPNNQFMDETLFRVSGKFELLDRILPKLKSTGHRILLFCQMTALMTIMEDFFTFKGYKHLRLDGSTKHEDRAEMLKEFCAPGSEYFIFLLSTRAGGLGLNLQAADTVIIFDSDWNPFQDMQAQDRAHRIGQQKEVRVLRLMTVNSIEEKILAAARYKLNIDEKVIQAGLFDRQSTAAERKQFLAQVLQQEDENDDDENDIPDDEAINQMIARSEEEFDRFQQMDLFRRRTESFKPSAKPRLVTEDEMPPSLMEMADRLDREDDEGFDNSTKDDVIKSGVRRRKDVDYSSDLLSDKQWLKTIDEDMDDDDDDILLTPKSSKKRGGGSTRKSGGPGSRGGRGARKRQFDEEDDDDVASSSTKKGRQGRGRGGANTPRSGRQSHAAQFVQDTGSKILEMVIAYKDSDERVLSEPFMQLPPRKQLPDYYDVIDRPMDFKKIRKKLSDGKYNNMDDLEHDVVMLCRNAQQYNTDESVIYNDAQILREVWYQVRKLHGQDKVVQQAQEQERPASGMASNDGHSNQSAESSQQKPPANYPQKNSPEFMNM